MPLAAQCVLDVEAGGVLSERQKQTVRLVNRGPSAMVAFVVQASARRGSASESSWNFVDAAVTGQPEQEVAPGESYTLALLVPADGSIRAGAIDITGARCGDGDLSGFLIEQRIRLRQDLPAARERLARLRADGASVAQIREALGKERRVLPAPANPMQFMNAVRANATVLMLPAMAWHVFCEMQRIEKASPNLTPDALLDQLDGSLAALSDRLDSALRH